MAQTPEMYTHIQQLCRSGHTNITAMCRELGIPRSVLSELASGRTKSLSTGNVARIAAYFGVPAESLLGIATPDTSTTPSVLQPEYLHLARHLQDIGLSRQSLAALADIATTLAEKEASE